MTSNSSNSSIAPVEHLTIAAAPGLFVILWASGFIGAKLGLPYAEPLTFLFLRMFRRGCVTRHYCIGCSYQMAEPRANI